MPKGDPADSRPPRNMGDLLYRAQTGPLCGGHAPGAINGAHKCGDFELPCSYCAPLSPIQNRAKKKIRAERDQPFAIPVEHDQPHKITMSRHEHMNGAAPAETYQRGGQAVPKRDSCVPQVNMPRHGHQVERAPAETYQHQGITQTSYIHQIVGSAQDEKYHSYGPPMQNTQAPTTGWWSGPTCCAHGSGGTCCDHGANPGGTFITLGLTDMGDEPYHRQHYTCKSIPKHALAETYRRQGQIDKRNGFN